MLFKRKIQIAVAILIAVSGVSAVYAQTPADVDQAFAYLAKYEFGQDRAALNPLVKAIRAVNSDPAAREKLAARLADLLPSVSVDAKRWICRNLAVIGTAANVPAILPLLNDPVTSDIGCRVLETMTAPEAGAALRDALKTLPDNLKSGVIGALGRRREPAAVPALAGLIAASDPAIAEAAVSALGVIGDPTACGALQEARKTAPDTLKIALANACLTCAERYIQSGKAEPATAVYESLFAAGEAGHVRAAALAGLVKTQPDQALNRVLTAMNDADPILAAAAAGMVRSKTGLPGAEVTAKFAELLAKAAPANQMLLLEALADRGDLSAGAAVLTVAEKAEDPVRLAALRALGKLGDAAAVDLMLRGAADGTGDLRRTSRASLTTLPGPGVNEALMKAAESGKPDYRVEAITALGERRATDAKSLLLRLADDKEASVSSEAFTALQIVAGADDQAALLAMLANAADESRRAKIEKTVIAVAQRINDVNARADATVQAYAATEPVELKAALLRILGGIANQKAYETVRAALAAAPAVRLAAVGVLAAWPDATPLNDLEEVARTSAVEDERAQAFNGYAQMLKTAPMLPSEALKRYTDAFAFSKNAAEKKLLLGGLGDVPLSAALELVQKMQGDAELTAEANLAAIKLANHLCGAYPDKAKAVAAAFASDPNDALRKQAEAVVKNVASFEDYLTAWSLSGPYLEEGKNAGLLYETVFPPEKSMADVKDWRIMPMGLKSNQPWVADLGTVLGGFERVAFLATKVQLPKEQDCIMELGSNDGVKVWINGELVHGKNIGRPLQPGEDKVKVHLKAENTIMMAVYNQGGEWASCVRFRTPEGGPVEGLKAAPFSE